MRVYQTPCGTWAGTQAKWAEAMRAEGCDHKQDIDKFAVEIPTSPKNSLLEWLTFHNVNILFPAAPEVVSQESAVPRPPAPPATGTTTPDIEQLVAAAPMSRQLEIAVAIVDRADKALREVRT